VPLPLFCPLLSLLRMSVNQDIFFPSVGVRVLSAFLHFAGTSCQTRATLIDGLFGFSQVYLYLRTVYHGASRWSA
jgi:hypothetical protein